MVGCSCGRNELAVNLLDNGKFLLVERTSEHVGAAWWQARERFAELEDVFLVHHQPIRAPKASLQ
jgi:hypothetical protein